MTAYGGSSSPSRKLWHGIPSRSNSWRTWPQLSWTCSLKLHRQGNCSQKWSKTFTIVIKNKIVVIIIILYCCRPSSYPLFHPNDFLCGERVWLRYHRDHIHLFSVTACYQCEDFFIHSSILLIISIIIIIIAIVKMVFTLSCRHLMASISSCLSPWPVGGRKYRHACT